jgi:hypothetical protein
MTKRPLQHVAPTDAATLRRVAAEAERSEPPAIVRRPREMVMVNIKLAKFSALDLARKAAAAGLTQKQFVARALQAAGIEIDPRDLEDRTPRRAA